MSDTRSEMKMSWREILDRATKDHQGKETSVEVVGEEYGDQVEAEHMALTSLSYDPKDDVVIVALGPLEGRNDPVLRHIVEQPREVLVDSVPPELPLTVEIVDGDGTTTIVSVHRGGTSESA